MSKGSFIFIIFIWLPGITVACSPSTSSQNLPTLAVLSTSTIQPTFTLVPTGAGNQSLRSDQSLMDMSFEIVSRQMPISRIESNFLVGRWDEGYRFKYEYVTDDYPFDLKQRVPFLLCGFQDAGLIDGDLEFTIEHKRTDGGPGQGSYFCVSPEVIQSLNCTNPEQMNLEAIQTSLDCKRSLN